MHRPLPRSHMFSMLSPRLGDCRQVSFCLVMTYCLCGAPFVPNADDTDKTVDAPSAAIDQRAHHVYFYCNAEIYSGFADSLEDAQHEQFISPSVLQAREEYVKNATMRRYKRGRLIARKKVDGHWDEAPDIVFVRTVRNQVYMGYYYDAMSREAPGLSFGETSNSLALPEEGPAAGPCETYKPCFVFGTWRSPNFLKHLRQLRKEGRHVTFAVSRPGRDSILIESVIKEAGSGSTRRVLMRFCDVTHFPVVREVTALQNHEGREVLQMQLFTSFVRVSGGRLPNKAIVISSTGKTSPRYAVIVWVSNDLGPREPQLDDSFLRVPKEVRANCVAPHALPPATGDFRTFDVAKMWKADISVECRKQEAKALSKSTRVRLWLIVATAMVSLALWGVYRCKQFRNTS
ncbi:MAG: hypothetical protein KatS3mg110_3784 [Pirellulaceae bacterium]|nr:MAG: hypothetical protein KatS3mg110_3771 [Pirellulaceae bacterium]GIW95743.1 MAG: hypothetical protein KatS3mg110_3784 [Pirellulaceae bacterium]